MINRYKLAFRLSYSLETLIDRELSSQHTNHTFANKNINNTQANEAKNLANNSCLNNDNQSWVIKSHPKLLIEKTNELH